MRIKKIYHKPVPAWTEEVKIYEFDELAEDVQQDIIARERKSFDDDCDFYYDEWKDTVKEISKLIGGRVDYEIGPFVYSYLKFNNHTEPFEEVFGPRAIAWIQNNWIDKAYEGKYFSTRKQHRYSNIMLSISDCPFTGVCYDCCFVEAWNDFKKAIKKGEELTVDDFVNMLEELLVKDIVSEVEYKFSRKGITEEIMERGMEFYEDGEEAI